MTPVPDMGWFKRFIIWWALVTVAALLWFFFSGCANPKYGCCANKNMVGYYPIQTKR